MKVSYNPFKYGETLFKPVEGEKQLKQANTVISEVEKYKDELVSLDNSRYDSDRLRGSVDIMGKGLHPDNNVSGNIKFDSYLDGNPVSHMNYCLTDKAEENTIIYNENTKQYEYVALENEDGKLETEIFRKIIHDKTADDTKDGFNRKLLRQEVVRDVETGYIMFRQEKIK